MTDEQIALAAELADKAERKYGSWTEWHGLPDGRRVRAQLESDSDCRIDDRYQSDCYGKLYGESRGRPAECNGAARKVRTRHGYVWWQPPADAVTDPEVLASVAGRVESYFLEQWWFLGVMIEVESTPCPHCGERKLGNSSVWGIESDSKEHIADTIADLIPDSGLPD